MQLNSKADNIRALRLGLFGNAPKQWNTVFDVEADVGPDHPIVVRPRTPGGRCWYDTTLREWGWKFCVGEDGDPNEYYFNEPIAKDSVLLNAEVTRMFGQLEMYCSTEPDHMRPALRSSGRRLFGLTALMMLRSRCCDRGRETIEGLLEAYPDHVIEFTAMSRPYGTLGWSSVVWEVRNY